MLNNLMVSVRLTTATVVLTGLLYPAVVTLVAQVLFPGAASGSRVRDDRGRVVGSALVGQAFTHPGYFWSRPSAAGAGYDAAASSGSNLGPTSRKLRERAGAEVQRFRQAQPGTAGMVPDDLVTASASGLDPHITPQGALFQVTRVARARGVSEARVRTVVDAYVEGRWLGLLGEPHVNVLTLNLALDRQLGAVVTPAVAP